MVDYRLVFDKGSAPCLVLAPDAPRFSVVAASDAYLRAAGVSRAATVGKAVLEVLAAGSLRTSRAQADALQAALGGVITTQAPCVVCIEPDAPPGSGPGATRRRSIIEATPIHAATGELAFVSLCVVRPDGASEAPDATRAARLELELDARRRDLTNALAELESFSYSVSHDLRAPLRAIDGFSQALAHDYGSVLDGQAHHYIDRVRAGAQRMSALIDDMLELSRIQRAPLRRTNVDLTEQARRIVRDLSNAHPERTVSVEVAPSLNAYADSQLLSTVLDKLIGNAWKFTSGTAEAVIRVGVDPTAPGTFFVADNGTGFDMTYASRLFSPFQRLHKASEFDGRGIGLAVAHRILARHGGRIWAEAEPGKGARFSFQVGARDE